MDFYFLLISLFFPRITLLVYLFQGWYPENLVPNWLDVVLGLIAPRILILIYTIRIWATRIYGSRPISSL